MSWVRVKNGASTHDTGLLNTAWAKVNDCACPPLEELAEDPYGAGTKWILIEDFEKKNEIGLTVSHDNKPD